MKRHEASDSELVNGYRQGDEQAFVQLVSRHKSKIYTAIYLIVKDQFVAEDLLQETFIKVIDTIRSGKYIEEGKFLPWVSRIAHNLAIDHFRKHKRYPTVVLEDGSVILNTMELAEESFEDQQIKAETYAHLRECVKRLPKPQREVLIMRHYFKMSFQEISDATGVSINTALGRMRYALINLRKLLSKNHKSYAESKETLSQLSA